MTAEVSGPPEIPGYEFIKLLARGGTAQVYAYSQAIPRRQVAVKVMTPRPEDGSSPDDLVAEAEDVAWLSDHPSVVSILTAGVTTDGRAYVVMPYLPGPDLGSLVRHDGPVQVSTTLHYGIQIAGAVETLHRAGLVHRDIKPSNVMLSAYGWPVLIDFGTTLTRGGDDARPPDMSLPWAAPEIVAGSSPGSAASDIYSLAATLHTLLSGRPPFGVPEPGETLRAQVRRVSTGIPGPIGRPDVPPELERVLRVAMSTSPDHRPPSAQILARELQRVETALGLPITPITLMDTTVPTASTYEPRAELRVDEEPAWGRTLRRSDLD